MKTKLCTKCDTTKPIDEFSKSAARGTQLYCKLCCQQRDKEHYHNNTLRKKQIREYAKKTRREVSLYIESLKQVGCSMCPEKEPCCMDFHHLENKSFTIGEAKNSYSLESIKREIEKCIIVCSNCHRKIHKDKAVNVLRL